MKRYLEFDIARTIVLLLLPIAHIVDIFQYYEISSEEALEIFSVFNVFAGFGAGIFMLCMGINIAISRNNTPSKLLKRVPGLLIAAVALNLLRYVLPGIIGSTVFSDSSILSMALISAVSSDILYFATLYILFMAIAERLNIRPLIIVLIAGVMSIADYIIPNPQLSEHAIVEGFIGNFIYINRYSSFAFLQWAIIPSIGYAFGYYLKRAVIKGEEELFWRRTSLLSVGVLAVLCTYCVVSGIDLSSISGNQDDTYNMELIGSLVVTSAALVVMYIIHLIAPYINSSKLRCFFTNFSKGITVYYMLQWIIIVWGALILYALGFDGSNASLTTIQVLVFYLIVTLICTVLTLLFQKKRRHSINTAELIQ